jgi:RNA polymerase sigma factor (sigma-70 family)
VNSIDQIVKGCLKQNRADQYRLYSFYSSKMFGVCLRYASSYDEAQDVLQEGFIKVFSSLGSFGGRGSLEGWIRKIMVNTAIERYRERVYLLPIEQADDDPNMFYENQGVQSLNVGELLELIQTLPDQYRMVFNLFVLEGYNHKEIGEVLGISESTSRSNLSRARLLLQQKINKNSVILGKAI